MTSSALLACRRAKWGLFVVLLSFAAPTADAEDNPVKVGILHSLSGTMAISEAALKDTVLMLIEDQNRKGGLLGRKLESVVANPNSDWDLFREIPGTTRKRKGRGCIRLLDIGLPQIGSADLRAAERPALLPGAIRG